MIMGWSRSGRGECDGVECDEVGYGGVEVRDKMECEGVECGGVECGKVGYGVEVRDKVECGEVECDGVGYGGVIYRGVGCD